MSSDPAAPPDPRDGVMIFNPWAARALRWRDRLRERLARLGVRRWWETGGSGHAAELARRAVTEGAELVVVGGGDGTVHEVANGLLGSGPTAPLFPLPLGTGNDFVRSLGLSLDVPAAVRALERRRTRTVDAGRVNGGEVFVNSAGFGFDAEVVRRHPRRLLFRSYTPTVVRTFLSYAPHAFEVVGDGRAYRGRALSISVLNGPYVGGGYRVAPDADAADGRFDVCLFEPVGLVRFARYVPRVRRGRHTDLPIFRTWRAERVTLRGACLAAHLDGEYRAFPGAAEVVLEVIPGALRVLA